VKTQTKKGDSSVALELSLVLAKNEIKACCWEKQESGWEGGGDEGARGGGGGGGGGGEGVGE